MANPWDVKLVCNLTESEMHAYVGHLQERHTVEVQERIDEAVKHILGQWHTALTGAPQQSSYYHPNEFRFVLPAIRATRQHSLAWVSAMGMKPITPAVSSYQEVRVNLPPWLPPEYAAYLAREQVMEQIQLDVE